MSGLLAGFFLLGCVIGYALGAIVGWHYGIKDRP